MTAVDVLGLDHFAAEVGPPTDGPVTIAGLGTRGGAVTGVRAVAAPAGIVEVQAAEMTVTCGAGTPVDDLDAALAEVGQRVSLPPGGTVGGALAAGHSDLTRLGRGPVRDALLQARYVSAAGTLVKAGGPTVKNVSGFDVCRLLVASRGTLGFLAEVILRTWPRPRDARWVRFDAPPFDLAAVAHRPAAVLWDGAATWMLLEGHPADLDVTIAALESAAGVAQLVAGPPPLPRGGRWSVAPNELSRPGREWATGRFVAEIGVGIVHSEVPAPRREVAPAVRDLTERLKRNFDPTGRLNPGVDVLNAR